MTEIKPDVPPRTPPKRRTREIPEGIRSEILRLHGTYGTRQIADRVGESRKIVRRVLREEGCLSLPPGDPTGKLDAFRDPIQERVLKRLTVSRILREIRELGYVGRRTILAEHVRKLRTQLALEAPAKKVRRRFETEPGREMQVDWSPFRVLVGGREVLAYALTVILASSRKLFLGFYRNEKQHSLLEGLASAFDYFGGCGIDLVLDNMATAVLGRHGADRKPIWHPAFLEFVRHHGVRPVACAPRDPDRKGKIEKPFRLVEDDFLKGKEFRSWEDLREEAARWLDHTPDAGNLRVHGTTGQVPQEAFLAEREFLIRLPGERFPTYEDTLRIVDNDCTVSILDRRYTVPSALANRTVAVRLFAHHFEVLDSERRVAFSRTYVGPEETRRLIIDPTHYAGLKRRPKAAHQERLDEGFLRRFPTLTELVDGLKMKMKAVASIHLRRLILLAETYGHDAFLSAATHAQSFRRFDAAAIARILERQHPEPPDEPIVPLGGRGAALLGEVDPGSLDGYAHLDDERTSDTSTTQKKGDDPDGA